MPFSSSAGLINIGKVGAGEVWNKTQTLATYDFDEDIKTGLFASFTTAGVLDNGVTGTLAGVVARKIENEITSDNTLSDVTSTVRYVRNGYITVTTKAGVTPAFGSKVYTGTSGEADTDSGATATNAEFIEKIDTNVWLIRLV